MQSLFSDGLHSIFAYLSDHDWLHALRTCHYWIKTGSSESTQHQRQIHHHDQSMRLTLLEAAQRSPLRHHLVHISEGDRGGGGGSGNEDDSAADWIAITYLPYFPSLTTLELHTLPFSVSLEPLTRCLSLTSLTLTRYLFAYEHSGTNTRCGFMPDCGSEARFHTQMEYIGNIPTLATLSIISPHSNSSRCLYALAALRCSKQNENECSFPQLQRFIMPNMQYKYLEQVLKIAPNLTDLQAQYYYDVTEIGKWKDFTQLRHLTLLHSNTIRPENVIPGLCACRQLESIRFTGWFPGQKEDWEKIFIALPKLASLTFRDQAPPWLFDDLLLVPQVRTQLGALTLEQVSIFGFDQTVKKLCSFIHLESLTLNLSGASLAAMENTMFDALVQHFDDVTLLPQLQRFVLQMVAIERRWIFDVNKKLKTASYRRQETKQVNSKSTSSPPAVGIELSPGPPI